MCQPGDRDVNKADKKSCSHRGYILEGKRHSTKKNKKKTACSVSYGERTTKSFFFFNQKRNTVYGVSMCKRKVCCNFKHRSKETLI